MELKDKKLYLLDMDGTIYLGDKLFEGAAEFLDHVKAMGGRYMFLTNNSSRGKEDYVRKLEGLGVEASPGDFFTSVDATVAVLKKRYGEGWRRKKIYVMGTESFIRQLADEGFYIVRDARLEPDIFLAGFDRELTYKKLEDACAILGSGADYFATNPDWVCPTETGYVPDCGAMCQMLEHATGRKPVFIGKPRPDMALMAMEKAGASKDETLLVGDRLYTDIACGSNARIETCFVLSGEGTLEDIERTGIKPDYVLEDIKELLRRIKNET